MCYRLIWNLKNTAKIQSFEEVVSIKFASIESKLYGLISCNGNKKFVFDLSKVYTDIPSTLNGKKFDVSPEGHEIQVTVNEGAEEIKTYLNSPNKEDDKTSQNVPVNNEEEEVTSDTVEEKILGNEEVEEEEKQEILEKFEENIVEKLEENGLKIEDEEEEKK